MHFRGFLSGFGKSQASSSVGSSNFHFLQTMWWRLFIFMVVVSLWCYMATSTFDVYAHLTVSSFLILLFAFPWDFSITLFLPWHSQPIIHVNGYNKQRVRREHLCPSSHVEWLFLVSETRHIKSMPIPVCCLVSRRYQKGDVCMLHSLRSSTNSKSVSAGDHNQRTRDNSEKRTERSVLHHLNAGALTARERRECTI